MRRNGKGAAVLLTASLLLVGCGEVGRYQLVVTPPFEGDGRYWDTQCHVLDTRTGEVLSRDGNDGVMVRWDPVNKTGSVDTITVTKRK
jgi:hypothetical protein